MAIIVGGGERWRRGWWEEKEGEGSSKEDKVNISQILKEGEGSLNKKMGQILGGTDFLNIKKKFEWEVDFLINNHENIDENKKLVMEKGEGSWEELKEGDKVDFLQVNIDKKKKLVMKEGEGSWDELKKGDKVNISKILFTQGSTDFLINNQGKKFYANHLKGKVIVLHFVPLAPLFDNARQNIDTLLDIYNAIHPIHPIEVVFIGFEVPTPQRSTSISYTKSSEEYFQDIFSIMPWTAIPFSHTTNSLNYWRTKLGYPSLYPPKFLTEHSSFSFVIDPAGVVLQLGAESIFFTYGAEAYPFSDQMVSDLEHQDEKELDHPSITHLLTSPGHEHVINCENKQVPVKDLEGKTVALYFYQDCYLPFDWFTQQLKDAYDDLMPAKKDEFEVVLVYIHDSYDAFGYASEDSFWNALYTMPWLALPFKHPRVQNLHRIFDFSIDSPTPGLVIVGPHGSFVEPYGADILNHFGVKACPFTRREAAKIEVDNIKKTLKLDMFLDPNTTFLQNGSKVKLSQPAGKKIILIVEAGICSVHHLFWKRLEERYRRMKEMGDPFEVIHIPNKDTSSSSTVPWLRGPPFPEKSDKRDLVRSVFSSEIGLLAFDGDGTIVRKTGYPQIQKKSVCFPFNDDGLEEEAVKDPIKVLRWDDSELVRGF